MKDADSSVCRFCTIKPAEDQFISATKFFNVIKNAFPYSIWDSQRVTDHLMITPKQHTDNLDVLEGAAQQEYVMLLAKYEKLGYNIYARAPSSTIKTVVHQHTHLIKTDKKTIRAVLLLRKPYIRLSL
jgi:diadenosine tetraphosphate (Ap4A) HIT family hydrolase